MNRRGVAAAAAGVSAGFSSFAFFLGGPRKRTRMRFASFVLGLLFGTTFLLGQTGAVPNWTVPLNISLEENESGAYFGGGGEFQNGAIAESSLTSGAQPASWGCPGVPALCGMTCSPDPFGTPIYCSNGQCSCAPGYDTTSGPSGTVCLPSAPEPIGTEARDSGDLGDMKYSCPGICMSDKDNVVGGAVLWSPVGNACQGGSKSGSTCLSSADCPGTCGPKTTGQCQGGTRDGLTCNGTTLTCPGGTCVAMGFCSGSGGLCQSDKDCSGQCIPVTYKPWDLVPVHGTAPGGEAFMPVWGYQATQCGDHGTTARCSAGTNKGGLCSTSADCPGGACTAFGICQGGSNVNGICFGSSDCAGTCGPLTEGMCQGGTRDALECQCPGGTCDSGLCQGGSRNGQNCNPTHDCLDNGRCVAIGFCSGRGSTCHTNADCQGICDPIANKRCSTDGRTCASDTDCLSGGTCTPVRGWGGCSPDPFAFCFGLQGSDEGDFDFDGCHSTEGCGGCSDVDTSQWAASLSGNPGDLCGKCVADFTSAWPYIDNSTLCSVGSNPNPFFQLGGVTDPARIDFPNNVIVYRAPIRWEEFSDKAGPIVGAIDSDYTWDTNSVGHELHDTDTQFIYHRGCLDENYGRVHTEFDRFESVNHFTNQDWGAANLWWRKLRSVTDPTCCFCAANPGVCIAFGLSLCAADPDSCTIGNSGSDRTNTTRCFVKSSVNPVLTCPTDENVDTDCSLHDPMAVTVGVPSLDCADDAYQGTDEIHPVLGMAIRIQENPQPETNPQPEKWAFFYRQTGGTGPCGGSSYSRCLSMFKLPLGLPVVSANKVLTGADVHVDWHAWRLDDSVPGDVNIDSSFDLTNGTVLNITLPHFDEGVVGLVTVTPAVDTTPPQITCTGNISKPVDLGKCTAAVTFPAPTVSDNCSVSAACNPPSGSAFPIGTTTDTCTATDQAGLTASCSFNVTVTAGNKCPHAQGYWKNHPSLWPVSSLTLGSVTYNKTQLLSILNNSTTGDASVILAREEIATLLSLANGSNPTPICGTIADADAALGASTVPAKVGPKTVLGQRMVGDANTLDSYNIGNLTPGCTP